MSKLLRKRNYKYTVDGRTYTAVDVGYHHDLGEPIGPFYLIQDDAGQNLGMAFRLKNGGYEWWDRYPTLRLKTVVGSRVKNPDPNIDEKIRIHGEIQSSSLQNSEV